MISISVYHGSYTEVRVPELRSSNRALDFGPGFYTTLNREQAEAFADIVRERMRVSMAVVNEYSVDFDALKTACVMKMFEGPNEEWLDFVSDNRNGIDVGSGFDAVYGPVANDKVFKTEKALGYIRFVRSVPIVSESEGR